MILVFVAGAVGISFAAIFIRLALPAPPVVTSFYRMLFASLLVGAWLAARGGLWRLPRRALLGALAAGLCFGADMALWSTAVVETTVATATLLVNITPVHVGLYSALVLRQSLDRRFVAGAALALAGCAVLLGFSWDELRHLRGSVLALTASVFYAGYLLFMSAARRGADAAPALFVASLGATAILGLSAALRGDPFTGFPVGSWAAMLGAAVVAQLGGVLGIVWALRFLPTTVASVTLLIQPVGATLWAFWLFGEALGPVQLLGATGVLAGIVLATRSVSGRAPRR